VFYEQLAEMTCVPWIDITIYPSQLLLPNSGPRAQNHTLKMAKSSFMSYDGSIFLALALALLFTASIHYWRVDPTQLGCTGSGILSGYTIAFYEK
jgi:hypothetical protein